MKKVFLTLALATAVIAAGAQTTIKANFKKGDTKTYVITETNDMGGQISTSNTTEMRYTVTDVDATKATIEYVMTAFETKSSGNEKGAEAMDEVQQIIAKLKDVPVIFETDADGKVQKLVNAETIQEKLNVAIKEFADKMYKMAPEMAQVMKKEDVEKQMHEKLTDAEILKFVADDIFDLYGKTISNGMVEDKEDHGVHMKVTYSVANIFGTENITAKGVANMSKEETKQLFFEQIDQAGLPDDQVRMIKSNFDQMAAAGMAKIEATDNTVYQIGEDGWLKGLKENSDINLFGQDMKQKKTITRK